MREVVKFMAFDGTLHDTKLECEEYEKSGCLEELERLQIELQQAKQVYLPDDFKRYKKALGRYREACKSSISLYERSQIISSYWTTKKRYMDTVNGYYKAKKLYENLKERAKAITAAQENVISK